MERNPTPHKTLLQLPFVWLEGKILKAGSCGQKANPEGMHLKDSG